MANNRSERGIPTYDLVARVHALEVEIAQFRLQNNKVLAENDLLKREKAELRRREKKILAKNEHLKLEKAELLRQNEDLLDHNKQLQQENAEKTFQTDTIKRLTRQLQAEKKANLDMQGFSGFELDEKQRLNPEVETLRIVQFLRLKSGFRIDDDDEDDDEELINSGDKIKDDPDGPSSSSANSESQSPAAETSTTIAASRFTAITPPSSITESVHSVSTQASPTLERGTTISPRTTNNRDDLLRPPSPRSIPSALKRKRVSDYRDDFDMEEHLKNERHRAIASKTKRVFGFPPFKPNHPLKPHPETFDYDLITGWDKNSEPYAYSSDTTPDDLKKKIKNLLAELKAIGGKKWLTKLETTYAPFEPPVCMAAKVLGNRTVWHSTNKGEYACRVCSEKRQPCFSWDGKKFRLLPLRPFDVAHKFDDSFEVGNWIRR